MFCCSVEASPNASIVPSNVTFHHRDAYRRALCSSRVANFDPAQYTMSPPGQSILLRGIICFVHVLPSAVDVLAGALRLLAKAQQRYPVA